MFLHRSKTNEPGHRRVIPLCSAAGFMRLCKRDGTRLYNCGSVGSRGHWRRQTAGGQALTGPVLALSPGQVTGVSVFSALMEMKIVKSV